MTTSWKAVSVVVLASLVVSTLGAPAAARRRCLGERASVVGTRGRDVLVGTRGNDVIVGRRGNDRIHGRGGDDLVCGGRGNDTISGEMEFTK